jgi:hypothetical protein
MIYMKINSHDAQSLVIAKLAQKAKLIYTTSGQISLVQSVSMVLVLHGDPGLKPAATRRRQLKIQPC